MNKLAIGLGTRFLALTMAIGLERGGSSTGNTLSEKCSALNCRTEAGMAVM